MYVSEIRPHPTSGTCVPFTMHMTIVGQVSLLYLIALKRTRATNLALPVPLLLLAARHSLPQPLQIAVLEFYLNA